MNQSHVFERSQLDVQQVPRQVDGLTVNKQIQLHGVDVVERSPEALVARKDAFVDAAQLRAVMA